MATIMRHKETGERYVLVGAGFGAYKSTMPGILLGPILPRREEGQISVVAVSDSQGEIIWASSDDMVVEEVDGQTPAEVLGEQVQ